MLERITSQGLIGEIFMTVEDIMIELLPCEQSHGMSDRFELFDTCPR
jgi:hypothetical protein